MRPLDLVPGSMQGLQSSDPPSLPRSPPIGSLLFPPAGHDNTRQQDTHNLKALELQPINQPSSCSLLMPYLTCFWLKFLNLALFRSRRIDSGTQEQCQKALPIHRTRYSVSSVDTALGAFFPALPTEGVTPSAVPLCDPS